MFGKADAAPQLEPKNERSRSTNKGSIMEESSSRKTYPPHVATSIETMGALAISIANRWKMG
jgi:hypothetical protein